MKRLIFTSMLAGALFGAAGCSAPCSERNPGECVGPAEDRPLPEPVDPKDGGVTEPEAANQEGLEMSFSEAFSSLSKGRCETEARLKSGAGPAASGEFPPGDFGLDQCSFTLKRTALVHGVVAVMAISASEEGAWSSTVAAPDEATLAVTIRSSMTGAALASRVAPILRFMFRDLQGSARFADLPLRLVKPEDLGVFGEPYVWSQERSGAEGSRVFRWGEGLSVVTSYRVPSNVTLDRMSGMFQVEFEPPGTESCMFEAEAVRERYMFPLGAPSWNFSAAISGQCMIDAPVTVSATLKFRPAWGAAPVEQRVSFLRGRPLSSRDISVKFELVDGSIRALELKNTAGFSLFDPSIYLSFNCQGSHFLPAMIGLKPAPKSPDVNALWPAEGMTSWSREQLLEMMNRISPNPRPCNSGKWELRGVRIFEDRVHVELERDQLPSAARLEE